MEIEELKKVVKSKMSEERYYHSICVMKRCEELAKKFGYDVETAIKVGLCHDIAKEMFPEEKIKYVKQNNIQIDEEEKENTSLLHGKIGKDIAIKELGFTEEMGLAISAHTTGLPHMSLLSKILFIADRTSEERNLKDIDLINELLEKNIDEAVLYILDQKIILQIKKRKSMHPITIIARNNIINEINLHACADDFVSPYKR